ncbi:hypothetical protein ACFE04_003358 [Oxalis oulophora]
MFEESSSSSREGDEGSQTQVILNVYDLTPVNGYTIWFGVGIFHSGIEVHGKEYGFGAHDFPMSGVFEVEPRKCPGFIYRRSLSLGHINTPPSEFRTFIENLASDYYGDTYNLITKNCNHFTDDVSWRLTGKRIPGWVNRLAHLGSVCSCLLPESLQVTTVKQLPECHESLLEDGSESVTTASFDDSDQEKHLLSSSAEHLLSLSAEHRDLSFVKQVLAES